jgi:hypothetical protein
MISLSVDPDFFLQQLPSILPLQRGAFTLAEELSRNKPAKMIVATIARGKIILLMMLVSNL